MPAAMVQLASCGNIFVLISSSEGRQVTNAMRIPPLQRPARQHLRREQPDGAPELKPEDMSDIADVSVPQFASFMSWPVFRYSFQ